MDTSRTFFILRRTYVDRDGYADGGRYFGIGDPVFCYGDYSTCHVEYVRAADREDAKCKILQRYPFVKFYR